MGWEGARTLPPRGVLILAWLPARGPDRLDHPGVGQSGGIAKLPLVGDIAEEPAHDLPTPRLRQIGGKEDLLWSSDGTDHLGHMDPQFLAQGFIGLNAGLHRDVGE